VPTKWASRSCATALRRQGYAVTAWTRGSGASAAIDGVTCIQGRDALWQRLPASEILINLLPLTADTAGLLSAACFTAMPGDGAVVNLGRGGHVVDADLLAALDAGHLRHAVLDVFTTEPLPAAHPYWSHDRVTLLPHAAALTDPRSAAQVVAANVRALDEGRPIAHRVDRARGY
jgi:glyoxylate/hydroxypyruvate reductase A